MSHRTTKKTLKLYAPHRGQLTFHNTDARFRVAAWGRQSGKSTGCLNDLLMRAWKQPRTKYWFVSPTHDQAKVQYRRLVGMLAPCWAVLKKKNQSELRIKLINDSEIQFKSGEVLHNLRGDALNGAVIDEVRDQDPDLWKQVIRPMLATTKGWAAFVSTPNGYDQFQEFFERGGRDKGWWRMSAPSTISPFFTKEEAEEAKSDMSEDEYAQEILAEFRDLQRGRAYGSFGDWNLKTQNPFCLVGQEFSPYLPIELYMDFNVVPLAWTYGQFREGRGHHFFGEVFLRQRTDTSEGIKEFISRFDWDKIKSEHQVVLVGDASGNSAKTSAAGETDYSLIGKALDVAGIRWTNMTPEANPKVRDRVNTMNARLRNALGEVQCTFNPETMPNTVKDFRRTTWKLGASAILDPGKDRMLGHLSDGVGYGICVRNPIERLTDDPHLRIVRR